VLLLQDDGRYRLNLEYFRHHREHLGFQWRNRAPQVDPVYSARLAELLGEPRQAGAEITERDRDIARSTQELFEAGLFNLLAAVHERYREESLCLAGGCAMNSVGNGKIVERSPFSQVYVPPAAGDAGGAIGAAATVWSQLGRGRPCGYMSRADWGPSFNLHEVEDVVATRLAELQEQGCVVERVDEDALLSETAQAIADGQIVGWFQGRMEWGPRALGNRSILCDPRRSEMKELLNSKIKRRESFRPFAPSILREEAGRWFAQDDDVPFMEKVFRVREERRAQIPAVVHEDGSGRLQTVERSAAPRYHALISRFYELTGVPCVLNTSFNESEPIVCTPDEAIDCFIRTDMDLLVLGVLRIARSRSRARDGRERQAQPLP
jgi:carbamoyltransferase